MNTGLTASEIRSAEKKAILSACWGSVSSVMISESAIVILFATMQGAGDMLSLVTTSLGSISNCVLLLPFAMIANNVGYKRTIIYSTFVAVFMICLVAFSPIFGAGSKIVMLSALAVFSIMMTLYVSAWFPLLDGFLDKNNRGRFFGRLRFSWQTTTMVYFFICGLVIGKNPPVYLLQIIILLTGFCMLGRSWYVRQIPALTEEKRRALKFKEGLLDALNNKPLCGFSVYICCLYLAAYATLPLTYVYLKKYLLVADNIVVIISSIALGGTMVGFLFAGRLVDKYGVKNLLLFIHFSFAIINISLFFIGSNSMFNLALISMLLTVYGFFLACSSVAISSEMMAMAPPDNKAVSMAFCGTFYAAGTGGSRLLTSLVLGSGMLAPKWYIGSMQISHYQTLFLLFGIAIVFVCLLLVLVPAIFPKSNYTYLQQ